MRTGNRDGQKQRSLPVLAWASRKRGVAASAGSAIATVAGGGAHPERVRGEGGPGTRRGRVCFARLNETAKERWVGGWGGKWRTCLSSSSVDE